MARPINLKSKNIADALTVRKQKNRNAKQIQQKIEPIPVTEEEIKRTKLNKTGLRDFSHCPRCGAVTIPSPTLSKVASQFWRECPKCNVYINTYIPQGHQQDFHRDVHRFKGNFGGYGSGKTTTTREEFYKHLFITPFGTGLIGANIMAQYEQTIKRDIEADFPAGLVKNVSVQKSYIEFVNGYRLMFRPFDDAGKLRSLNLDFIAIIEGSEVDAQILTIGKTRLRNTAATRQLEVDGDLQFTMQNGAVVPIIQNDWRQTIVESNPDAGWIKSDILLVSEDIQYNGPTLDLYDVSEENKDSATSAHVTDTSCNAYLPPNYMRDVAKGKPTWWVNRYLHGSFTYAEGLVYPSAITNAKTGVAHVVPTRPIPKEWKRRFAFDYGLSDMAGGLWGAIDEERCKLIIYREFYVNDRNVKVLADLIKEGSQDVPLGGWLGAHLIDPKSGVKRDYDKKTLITHFLEYGINFVPGQISIDARVFKTNTYFEFDQIEIMDCCVNLIKEISDYKFPSDLKSETGRKDKPEDKNNHLINPLEWLVMELPANPADILYGVYNNRGLDVTQQRAHDEFAYTRHVFGKTVDLPEGIDYTKNVNNNMDDSCYRNMSGIQDTETTFYGGNF